MDRPREPRVLLLKLTQRTSGKGNAYLAGWMGQARLVGFKGEPDKHGNETRLVYASEPPPKEGEGRGRRAEVRPVMNAEQFTLATGWERDGCPR